MNKVTGVLIDVKNRTIVVYTVNSGSLEEYYNILNCTTFDIASRRIGENVYDIYCDDEGLLQCNPIVSAVSSDRNPMLVGNLFVTKTNDEGETISLTQEEISEVLDSVIDLYDEDGNVWPAIVCDY